ncbi:acyltransferase family protein [Marinicella sediminis]|uniref:Acyltransferase family protein n=1 Tax=Marinicella sediminis TaxID=1792834 RepID=A0ABV7J708_9GAMM|nr:acyltransferase family protein [Marinicella sediminis]
MMMHQTENFRRLHHMDNLRALAMLLGVVFHASLAYSPMLHFFWLSSDTEKSASIDVFAWFTHLFRMPLFFLIAGFFAVFLLHKRGLTGFLRNRLLRVLTPLLIFLPLVLWTMYLAIIWASQNVENPSPVLNFIFMAMDSEQSSEQPISTAHLWFLYYLCFFYLITAVFWKLGLYQLKQTALLFKPWVMVVLVPLLFVPGFYLVNAPHPAPEGLQPLFWPFILYGLFFLIGSLLYHHQQAIDQLTGYRWWLLLAGLASYGYFNHRVPAAEGDVLMALSESITAWYLTLWCVIAGQRYLNQHNRTFRYIADASYWIYLIHLPLLMVIQYAMLDTAWNLWLEFSLSVLLTMVIGLLSYALLVRHTPIGWMLNCKRPRASKQQQH